MIKQKQIRFFVIALLVSLSFAVSCTLAQAMTEEETRVQKKEIEMLYRDAMSLYFTFSVASQDEGDVLKSKEIFEKVLEIDPSQKKAKIYLNEKIPARLEKLKRIRQEEKKRAADQKILDEEKRRKREKLEAKRKIQREERRQKQEERSIQEEAKQQDKLRRRAEAEAEGRARREEYLTQQEKNREAKILYKEAFRLYYDDRLREAKKVFERILKIDPGQEQARIFIEKRIPSRQKKLELKQ